jgi:hypothetical protein
MSKRSLKFTNDLMGTPASGVCTACGAKFIGKLPGDPIEQVKQAYDAHSCKEDASQAAARIVREATGE